MTRLRTILTAALYALALPLTISAQKQPAREIQELAAETGVGISDGVQRGETGWEILGPSAESLVWYHYPTGLAIATNGVLVKYGGAILTAQTLTLDQASGEAIADGNVRIQQDEQLWAGEHIRYNFKTRQMEAEQFRTGKAPVFVAGQHLHAELSNRVYVATNALITTDDVAVPAIKIRAKYIRIIPGERIEAHHATLYVGDVPLFYFPYYSRNLGPRANNFTFVPGYRSSFGPFLLANYTWFLNEQLDGVVHVDYRERRGVGAGPDLNYHLGRWGQGAFRYYYLHDNDPNVGVTNASIPENRQRVYFSYYATPFTNLELRSLMQYQSDNRILRDFFESEYRQSPQLNSFVEASKFWQNFSLDTLAQPRLNDFFETVERLPDVRLTGYRQQLGASPLFYESESSAGYYRRRFAQTNGPVPLDYEAGRADSFHQLLWPQTFFGWLNLTPRAGGRFTYYSRATGPGATTDELARGVFNTGAELTFKASRVWPAAQNSFLQVDGLRHIIEPSVNYVFVPAPNHRTNDLPQFDYELPSLRLLPIEYPDYNSIDSIDSQNVIRFGLHNKLQTKRQGEIQTLADWDLLTDWRLRPQPGQTTFADVYSDLVVKPRSWLTLESLTRYDIDGGQWRLAFHTLTVQPNDRWSWSLAHWYLRDDFRPITTALGQGNNLFTSMVSYRLNENWSVRATHRFEARDGRLEEQSYSVYRDLRSWTAALTFRLLDNRVGPEDFTVAFTFSFKARPRSGLGADALKPYSLWGG